MTFSGLFVPLITPFTADGDVALRALESLAHELLDAGATGLVALGTTGEPSALTPAERAAVLAVVERVSRTRRTPWIAGVHDGIVPASADAAMHAVPAFVRPGEEGVIAHFAALAAASPVPVVVYHVPYRTAQPLSAGALLRLASLPNVIAMKYAPGTLDATAMAFMAAAADVPGFSILVGDDVLAGPLLALGAPGAVMAAGHIATADYAALIAAWQSGDLPGGRALSHRLAPRSAALFAAPNPTVIKGVLHAEGRIPSAAVRVPLTPAAPEQVAQARGLLTLVSPERAAQGLSTPVTPEQVAHV
ncbi:dihydrodipicolinate synthase family protein [Actinoplanes sp. NPDC051411]|uniref:dihydrodipicolinate synthase family protein n=1 Tax=Actinoplanes sp. NPDC051411 TaxID=3155522 RepID=UPI0034342C77